MNQNQRTLFLAPESIPTFTHTRISCAQIPERTSTLSARNVQYPGKDDDRSTTVRGHVQSSIPTVISPNACVLTLTVDSVGIMVSAFVPFCLDDDDDDDGGESASDSGDTEVEVGGELTARVGKPDMWGDPKTAGRPT